MAIGSKAADGALDILQCLFLSELSSELQNNLYFIILNCVSFFFFFLILSYDLEWARIQNTHNFYSKYLKQICRTGWLANNRMRTSQLEFHSGTEGLLDNGNCSAVLVTALNPVASSFGGCSSCSWGVLPDWGL